MPLIVLSGLPCSGKTVRANELKQFFEGTFNIRTTIISDQDRGLYRNEMYIDSSSEKQLRGTLKSEIQRAINKQDVLIFDSLNYIKGYRYEVYCIIKSAQTPQCLVHCDIASSQAAEWNQARPEADRYSQDIFDGLVMRFEPPDSRNRWDSPLFLVHPEEQLPFQQIYDALFNCKAPPPNHSTLPQPLSSTNFLHELDTMTQSIIKLIVDAQKTAVVGTQLPVPGTNEKVALNRIMTLMELQRLRREFISFTKTRPVEDPSIIANMFVQFLNGRTQ